MKLPFVFLLLLLSFVGCAQMPPTTNAPRAAEIAETAAQTDVRIPI